jgi:ABC-type amino acid transport substrate-binding protein
MLANLKYVNVQTYARGMKLAVSKYVAGVGMIIVAVVAFAIGLYANPLIMPSARATDKSWDNVVSAGKIRAGTEPGWPPYEYLNTTTSQIIGFEIELMEAIASKLNLTVEWHNVGFDTIIPAIQSGELELGVSGFSVTADRLEVVQFTMPHSITEGQIIMLNSTKTAKGIDMLTSISQLSTLNIKVGTQTGTTEEGELLGAIPHGLVTSYTTYLDALTAMKTGLIDCVYAETPITSNWILEASQQSQPPIVIVYRRPYYPVAFVANKDANRLVAKINGALAEIIASGQVDTLKQKWKC